MVFLTSSSQLLDSVLVEFVNNGTYEKMRSYKLCYENGAFYKKRLKKYHIVTILIMKLHIKYLIIIMMSVKVQILCHMKAIMIPSVSIMIL